MKKILSSVIKQPVTVVMLTLLLIFGGVVGTLGMPLQLIPDMQIPIVSVVVTYPGASAATVEDTVTVKVSDALGGVNGVEQVYTFSYDNVSAVMLEFGFGVDIEEKKSEMLRHVTALDLPDGCSDPEVTDVDLNGEATATLYVTAGSGDVELAAEEAEKFASSLSAINGVGSVELDGEPAHGVTVRPIKGLESGILLLVQALSGGEYDLPLGSIETSDGAVQVRNLSDVTDTDDIRALPVTLPAEITAMLAGGEELFTYYENATPEELNEALDEIDDGQPGTDDLRDSLAAIDALYAENDYTRIEDYAMVKYYGELLGLPSDVLYSAYTSDRYSALTKAAKDLTDGEIYDLADTLEETIGGLPVGAETLFMARSDANDGYGLGDIAEYRHAKEQSATLVGLYSPTDADRAELAESAELTQTGAEDVAFVSEYNRSGLSAVARAKYNNEPLDASDYAMLYAGTERAADLPFIATSTGMKFILSEHYAENAQTLRDFKTENPSLLDAQKSYELYTLLDLSDVTDFELTEGLVTLMRGKDFSADGVSIVKIGDIATVTGPGDEGYTPAYDAYAYLDGVQGVKISVFAAQGANGAEIVRQIKDAVANTVFSDGVRVVLTDDQSEFISDSVSGVLVSMIIGGVLAVLVIYVFLRKVKPSLIISVTMPLSVLSALLLLSLLGITLNMVSLGGLAVGIGMLVDNSIVVIEAISKRRDAGDRPYRAAVNGTAEVAGALVGSTLTTVCAFIPIMFVGGLCAEIFTDMAWAVIWSLTFSLLVAVTVIPTMYVLFSPDGRLLRGGSLAKAELKKEDAEMTAPSELVTETTAVAAEATTSEAPATGTRKKPRRSVMGAVEKAYGKLIERVLRFKALVVVIAVILFAGSMALAFTAGTEFLPSVDKGQINIGLAYNGGTSLEEAESDAFGLADSIESAVDGIESISVSVGVQGLLAFNNTGSIDIKLGKTAGKTSEVTQRIREIVMTARSEGKLPNTSAATVTEIDGVVESLTGGMSDISVTVRGEEQALLAEIGAECTAILSTGKYAERGFVNVTDSMGEDNKVTEYDIGFDRYALAERGIDYAQAVMTLRVGLAGYTAATATVDGVDCDVTVVFEDGAVADIDDLEAFVLGYYDGEAVRLRDVATITRTEADSVIKKEDGAYSITITAEVYDLDSGTAVELMREAAESVLARECEDGVTYADKGYVCVSSGVATYLDDAFSGLYVALVVSLLLLFGVMAAQFGSAIKPLIIMCAIPFSFTGGFLALAITGSTLNVVSLVGLIMLMGVIVNNAIVMLEKIKQLQEEGYSHYEAVVKGCSSRLRPILMTTLTTVLALIPLALGLGSGGELMQPLGIVVMGGLLVGTLVTLVLIPCIYCGINRVKKQ